MAKDALQSTVQDLYTADNYFDSLTFYFAAAHEAIEPWGQNWARRDRQLKEFYLTEPFLVSTVFNIATARAAFSFELSGPPKLVKVANNILHSSNFKEGWINLQLKVAIDALTSEVGGVIEIIRDSPARGRKPESAPVRGLAHMDASRVIKTGDPRFPIYYVRDDGEMIKMPWYSVITLEDFPSPLKEAKGRQVCFVSRVLKMAQIMREVTKYEEEKVSGRFHREIHIVSGVSKAEIENTRREADINNDNMGLLRYSQPIILTSLDPNARITKESIPLASLPDHFNKDEMLKHYITLLALASGGDYQDLAPLSGGNLGTASQSEILHRKSQSRGAELWRKLLEHKLQYSGVIPKSVSFTYRQQDAAAEAEMARIAKLRAEERKLRIDSEEITTEIARQIAVDAGDLKQEYLVMMGDLEETVSITVPDDEPVPDVESKELSNLPVPIKVAEIAGKHIVSLIEQSPAQSLAPIPEDQLLLFGQYIRNSITKEMSIGTTDAWQDYVLTKAAYESGIHPHALRFRLPSNYRIYVKSDGILTDRGYVYHHIVPKKDRPLQVQKSKGLYCYACGDHKHTYTYLPFKGWKGVCKRHSNHGLIGKDNALQYNLTELKQAFSEQYLALKETKGYNIEGLLVSTLVYAYKLGLQDYRVQLDKDEMEELKKEIERQRLLLEVVDTPEPFLLPISTFYNKGLLKRF